MVGFFNFMLTSGREQLRAPSRCEEKACREAGRKRANAGQSAGPGGPSGDLRVPFLQCVRKFRRGTAMTSQGWRGMEAEQVRGKSLPGGPRRDLLTPSFSNGSAGLP